MPKQTTCFRWPWFFFCVNGNRMLIHETWRRSTNDINYLNTIYCHLFHNQSSHWSKSINVTIIYFKSLCLKKKWKKKNIIHNYLQPLTFDNFFHLITFIPFYILPISFQTLPVPGKNPSGDRPLGQCPWVGGFGVVSPLNGDVGSPPSSPDWAATSFHSCWISVGDIIPGGYKNGLVRKNMTVISWWFPHHSQYRSRCFSDPKLLAVSALNSGSVVSGRKFNQCSCFPSMINKACVVFSPQQ